MACLVCLDPRDTVVCLENQEVMDKLDVQVTRVNLDHLVLLEDMEIQDLKDHQEREAVMVHQDNLGYVEMMEHQENQASRGLWAHQDLLASLELLDQREIVENQDQEVLLVCLVRLVKMATLVHQGMLDSQDRLETMVPQDLREIWEFLAPQEPLDSQDLKDLQDHLALQDQQDLREMLDQMEDQARQVSQAKGENQVPRVFRVCQDLLELRERGVHQDL